MTINPRLVQHGTVGGSPINVDLSRLEHGVAVRVRLTANYAISGGSGVPSRPSMTGASAPNLDYPRTIPSGTTLSLHKGEADALVAAGAAVYL